jgi:hypothetical protein
MEFINNSKYVAGITYIVYAMGAKYLHLDMARTHEMILSNFYVKYAIIFSMLFIATRDVKVALGLLLIYGIIVDGLMNEKRKFTLVPQWMLGVPNIKVDDYLRAKEIVKTYESWNNSSQDNNYQKKYDQYLQYKERLR